MKESEENDCDHKGSWRSIGTSGAMEAQRYNVYYSAQRQFIAVIFCEKCGKIKIEKVED